MTAPRHLGRRYGDARAFLQALDDFWGREGWVGADHDERTYLAACPCCRSKALRRESRSRGYSLVVVEADSGWALDAGCGCDERAILAALADPGARRLRLRAAADVRARPVRWLYRDLLPLGKVSVLAGAPGLGKSILSGWLAAMVSTGAAPGDLERDPADVLLASAEDDPEDTIKPRLIAAGADLERVQLVDLREEGADGLPAAGLVQLPRDAAMVEEAVLATGAKLVVLDPVVAFLDADHSAYREQDVRAALAPLKALAEDAGCAVVVVMHLNKADGADPLRRIGNSGAFTALARSVLLLGRDPEDEDGDGRVLAAVKGNVRPASAGGLALRLVPRRVAGDLGEAIDTAALEVVGESRVGAEDLLGSAEDRSALGEATVWLRELLADGPVLARDALTAAGAEGHAKRTVERAKVALGVRRIKLGGPGTPWAWALPGDEPGGDGRVPDDAKGAGPTRNRGGVGGVGGLSSTKPNEGREGWRPYLTPPADPSQAAKAASAPRAGARTSAATNGGPPERAPSRTLTEDELVERLKREFDAEELGPGDDLGHEIDPPADREGGA